MTKKAQKRKAAKKPKKEPKPKKAKSEKQGERTRLLAENPSLTPDELPPVVLHHLIRAVQKHQVADWQAYVRQAEPTQKKTDPAAHSVEVLRTFVKQLLQGEEESSSAAGGGKSADFVKRYLKWTHQINKEHACQATSMPAPATIRALTPPTVNPSPASPSPGKAAAGSTAATGASTQNFEPSSSGRGNGPPMSPWVLVQATRNHPKFRALYNLPSYLPGWARTKRRALGRAPPSAAGSEQQPNPNAGGSGDGNGSGSAEQRGLAPVLLAMDCEMCETDKEQAALVGLCVSDECGRVLYQALVRPRGDITNLRTEVTGITQQDLDTKPTVSRSEARKAVKGLLLDTWRKRKQPTILVGHALHHDLMALRLDHQPVIDTSLIFGYQGLPSCTPGLRDLSLSVLQQDMPARGQGRHDSLEDATVSMKLVQHELAQRQRTPPFPPPEIKVDKADLSKLLVHSIPKGTTEQEILDLFAQAGAAAAAANGTPASQPTASAAKQAQDLAAAKKEGDGESSSESESDSDGDSEGSSSSEDSESESESESEGEEGDKKKQKTSEQGTPGKQQQQQQEAKQGGSGGSSSDSSESDSSESDSEEEEEEKGKGKKDQEKAKGNAAAASAATAAGSSGTASSSSSYQVPQPTGFEGKGIENKRAVLLFKNPDHATTAFNSLKGPTETDSTGRMVKEVQLPGEPLRTLKVRRMAAHNGLLFQVPKGAKKGQPPVQLPGTGPDGQPLTRRDKYRQRELLGKKKKKPQDLLAAQAKTMKKKVRREKKKERKAAVAESQGKVVIRTPKGPKVKRQRPFKKKTPAEKAAAHAAAVAAGGKLPDGRHVKITKKDQKKAEKKAAKAQHAQKKQEKATAQAQKKAE